MQRKDDGDDFGCRPPQQLLCAESDEALIAIDNGLLLGEYALSIAKKWSGTYRFTSDLICEFNRIAMTGIYESAGRFRDVFRSPSNFTPPHHRYISQLIAEMCDYANSQRGNPFHAAAFLLWRTNWIHPFYDGNGRISRELCHIAVLAATGDSWDTPLPELIADDEATYTLGLIDADKKWDGDLPGVNMLESFLTALYIDHATFPNDAGE